MILSYEPLISCSNAMHVTCSTDTDSRMTCSKTFYKLMQLQGFLIDSHTYICVSQMYDKFNILMSLLSLVPRLKSGSGLGTKLVIAIYKQIRHLLRSWVLSAVEKIINFSLGRRHTERKVQNFVDCSCTICT